MKSEDDNESENDSEFMIKVKRVESGKDGTSCGKRAAISHLRKDGWEYESILG